MPFKDEDFKVIHREAGFLADACELTDAERAEFGYLDWPAIDDGRDGATFVRHRGQLYDLSGFTCTQDPQVTALGWHGRHDDTAFSAVVVHIDPDGESAITGLMISR